jgi:hypothetical protein
VFFKKLKNKGLTGFLLDVWVGGAPLREIFFLGYTKYIFFHHK